MDVSSSQEENFPFLITVHIVCLCQIASELNFSICLYLRPMAAEHKKNLENAFNVQRQLKNDENVRCKKERLTSQVNRHEKIRQHSKNVNEAYRSNIGTLMITSYSVENAYKMCKKLKIEQTSGKARYTKYVTSEQPNLVCTLNC
uniref:Uncharacterized protein n=1 Tax=Glossina brevipalpis TaxID=37001 RepID=A0A1A9WMR9_9MUSC